MLTTDTKSAAKSLVLWTDDDGFARSKIVDTETLAAFVAALEADFAYNVDWQDWDFEPAATAGGATYWTAK